MTVKRNSRLSEDVQAVLARGGTVVTPTAQQAFQLRLAWAELQRERGECWETPDAIAVSGWLSREWLRAYAHDDEGKLPLLLSSLQEQALWEKVLDESNAGSFLQPTGVARAARRAWRLLHDWNIDPASVRQHGGDEPTAFAEWASLFAECTRSSDWIDAARAQWRVAQLIARPSAWHPAGFDTEPPSLKALAAELGQPTMSAGPQPNTGRASRVAAPDAASELELAAAWCRERLLGDANARLLVIVQDLESRRSSVGLAFDDILSPGCVSSSPLVAIEGGPPLDRYPLVETALVALALASGKVEFDVVSRWIRSPYLREGRARAAVRARTDVRLREVLTTDVSLEQLVRQWQATAHGEEPLLAGLRHLQTLHRGRRSLSGWSSQFDGALRALGWPGDAGLDSAGQQTLEKFKQCLGALGTLDEIVGQVDIDTARRRLARIARDTAFQPETRDARVVVTSRLGDPAVAWDGIWVTGLHESAWPAAPRPDPFLPWELQRAARIPQATAEGTRALAGRVMSRLLASAADVICSWPQRVDEEESLPSPLIASFPLQQRPAHERAAYRDAIHRAARLEELRDERAPPAAAPERLRGGAGTFKLQSLCPFRAFAQQRLEAKALEQPEPAVNPRMRGQLVHDALREFWGEIPTQQALNALDDQALVEMLARVARAVTGGIAPEDLAPPLAALERERMVGVMREFMALERRRLPFRVVARELGVETNIAGFDCRLQVDRVDELPDGRRVVIDYKTGEASARAWEDERPDDPQLPLYAVTLDVAPSAVAFGVLRTGECAFKGVSSFPAPFAGATLVDNWPAQLAEWRAMLQRLAEDFLSGRAEVNPKTRQTCNLCHLHALCRIDERAGALEDDNDGE